MSADWPKVALGEVLSHRKDFIQIDDLKTYKRCRVQLHAQGIVLRDIVPGAEIKTKKQQLCRANEFLVAEIDAKVGGYGIVPADLEEAIVSSHYFLFEINEAKIDRRFLDYYTHTPPFREQVEAQGSTNYAAIRPSHVLGYTISLPPLAEQQRIVARVEAIAERVAEARRLREEATLATDAICENGFREIFDKLVRRFSSTTFRESCNVVRGGSPRPAGSPVYYYGSIPFLRVADLTKNNAKFVEQHVFTIKEAGRSRTRWVEPGTLMLTNSGATLGVPKICTFGTTFNDGIQAFLRLDQKIDKEYLYYFLRSKTRWFRDWAARGQGQPNLNTEMVKQMSFPLPPLPEQRRIVAHLDAIQAKADALCSLQSETAAELEALLPAVLAQAFAGKL